MGLAALNQNDPAAVATATAAFLRSTSGEGAGAGSAASTDGGLQPTALSNGYNEQAQAVPPEDDPVESFETASGGTALGPILLPQRIYPLNMRQTVFQKWIPISHAAVMLAQRRLQTESEETRRREVEEESAYQYSEVASHTPAQQQDRALERQQLKHAQAAALQAEKASAPTFISLIDAQAQLRAREEGGGVIPLPTAAVAGAGGPSVGGHRKIQSGTIALKLRCISLNLFRARLLGYR
jgi:hypothetical protein